MIDENGGGQIGVSKGFCSIFVMVLVMFVALIGSFLLLVAERENLIATDFFAGIAAENLAYAGICDIMVKIEQKDVVCDEKLKLDVKSLPVYLPGKYQAYLIYKDGKLIVFSIGEYNKAKRQLVAYLRVSDQREVSIMYLNRK